MSAKYAIPAALSVALAILCPALPSTRAAGGDEAENRAVALYDAGAWAEALPLLERLETAGSADGPLLYRLYYCRDKLGDPAARDTLRRSIEAMEAEVADADDLEAPFYLVNAYQRVGRLTDLKQVALAATARVESGALAEPATPLGMFRLGKLYEDAENTGRALAWYSRAIGGEASSEASEGEALPDAYVAWAARRVAEDAAGRDDQQALEAALARVAASGAATQADLDRLAVTRVRMRRYADAAEAWRLAVQANPAQGDRARYCGSLARVAAETGELPAAAPDGRAWSELSPAELEQLMLERATKAKERIAAAQEPGHGPDREGRVALAAELAADHAVFVAAGLEYALRGLDIRQAAFSGGYAPMVFHAKRWRFE